MRLAVFTVCMPDYDFASAAKVLSELGYQGVEWRITQRQVDKTAEYSYWANNLCTVDDKEFVADPEPVKAATEKYGLQVPSLGTYVSADNLELVEGLMKSAKAVGAPCLRVGLPRRMDDETYDQIFSRAQKAFYPVQDLAKNYGIKAVIEIHHGRITASASAARRFVEPFDPKYIGVIHDAGNMVHEGFESYMNGFQLLGGYLAHVHIKNAVIVPAGEDEKIGFSRWTSQWAPMRKGMVNFVNLFEALKAVGYDGWLSLEDFSTELPTKEKLADDRKYLLDIAASVGI